MNFTRLFLITVLLAMFLGALLPFIERLLTEPAREHFLVKPYIQLGNRPSLSDPECLTVAWIAPDTHSNWLAEFKPLINLPWRPAPTPAVKGIRLPYLPPMAMCSTAFDGLVPGEIFAYRIVKDGEVLFAATGKARKSPAQPYRFVVFGDLAAGTSPQRRVAYQTHLAKPDFVFLTGDLVYTLGRFSEYLLKYFPVYNADESSPATGAPLIRSTLFMAAPGNHDIGSTQSGTSRNLNVFPDGMAYFLLWDQPLNGPTTTPGASNTPSLFASNARKEMFQEAAGNRYPRMANFSFDYGNSHWTVLDGNDYMDWTNPDLRAWVQRDLASAAGATWRFVGFHQSAFSSGPAHFNEQRMRLLADVFEKGRVDIVFSGHQHSYQRTFPLRFQITPQPDGRLLTPHGEAQGSFKLDRAFDGRIQQQPDGVIYIITGAGGAQATGGEAQYDSTSWQPYTHRFIGDRHSLTVCDVDGDTLTVRQVSDAGVQLDRFVISRVPATMPKRAVEMQEPAETGSRNR